MNRLIKYGVILPVLWSVFSTAAKAEIIDRVVALVDEDVVLASELVRRTNTIIDQIKAQNQEIPPINKLREQVLERLIVESLQLQMAKRVGVRVNDAELNAALERVANESGLSLDQFRQQIEASGMTWPIFREDVRNEIMISRVRQGMVNRRIQVSDREIENIIEQINQEGESRMQYELGHIMLPLPEGSAPEDVAKVRDKAQNLVKELRNGANFQEYAMTYSAGERALSGGNLGWRSLSQIPSLFADPVRNMKVGDVTEPLRSGSGLHIIKLLDSKGGFEKQTVQQTHARHILISPDAITDDAAALAKAKEIRQRILDGEEFEKLAIEHSDDKGSGALGGDLKWADPGKFVPEFENAMNNLAVNELSEPVKTQYGYHIIEVLGRRAQDQTEEKKRERAYQLLHGRKFEEEALLWIRELKSQAYIKIIDDV